MNRLTWFTAGAVTGVYALFKARRAARNFTPDGLAARRSALVAGLRVFTAQVASETAEREAELRRQVDLTDAGLAVVVPAVLQRTPERTPALATASSAEGNDNRLYGHR